jgi:putative transposase
MRSVCRTLEVSRSGYDAWRSRPPRAGAAVDQQVHARVPPYVAQGRGIDGTRRRKHLLAQEALQVSRWRLGRLLAQAGLRCKTRRTFLAPRRTAHAQTIAPHQRNRACTVPVPDSV